jgi:predicted ATP-grasp superfamily ATP-dependent carboligase
VKGRVLVAGFATRHVVQSAFRAGYDVFAVDHFCDQDLCWYTKERRTFEELDEMAAVVEEMVRAHPIDILVVTSGAEDLTTALPLHGTPRECVERFLDKLEMQQFFENHSIPVPALAKPGEFPVMVKPRRGAGGWRNQVVADTEELALWEDLWPEVPYLTQHLVSGIPCSVSCVCDGKRARAVAVNEQLLRGSETTRAFGFSGAITPFRHPLAEQMVRIAETAAAASGCIGSLGVDFITDDERTWAIEINPRFQATLDTVELATGCNLFDLHIDACRGVLPPPLAPAGRYAVRRILFADEDLVVRDDLSGLSPSVADIPWPGAEIEEGSAVISAYGWGPSRTDALRMLDKTITKVRRYMTRW